MKGNTMKGAVPAMIGCWYCSLQMSPILDTLVFSEVGVGAVLVCLLLLGPAAAACGRKQSCAGWSGDRTFT
jgi:hypothetical protein